MKHVRGLIFQPWYHGALIPGSKVHRDSLLCRPASHCNEMRGRSDSLQAPDFMWLGADSACSLGWNPHVLAPYRR